MIKKNEIQILLPAYNEEENLKLMVETWQKQKNTLLEKYGLNLRILVINDGSKDRTEEICNELKNHYKNFSYISHQRNKGLGEALKTGMLYVADYGTACRFICVMDCDNTQNPRYISSMLDKIGANQSTRKADVIIASRYRKGSKVEGVAKYRLLTSEGAKYVYSLILHVANVRDYTCGYRLYTADIIGKCYKAFGKAMIEETGFTCMAELLYKLYIVGARFDEIPFVLRYDYKQGKSKMKVIKTAINSIKLAFHLKGLQREINKSQP